MTFREQLFDIEKTIARGNTQAILTELNRVTELAKDITTKYDKKISLGELSISLSPSITIPLNISKNHKKALHTTFIRNLINFGVYER